MNLRRSETALRIAVVAWFCGMVACSSSSTPAPVLKKGFEGTRVTLSLPSAPSPVQIKANRLSIDPEGGGTSLRGNVVVTIKGPSMFHVTADQLDMDRDGQKLALRGNVHAAIETGTTP